MFDPRIGRWLSENPEGFEAGDTNLYRYVGNAPTNAVDPSGVLEEPPARNPLGVYYNLRIRQIGENAKMRIAENAVGNVVMAHLNDRPTRPNSLARPTGTFTIPQPTTFPQAVGVGGRLDTAIANARANAENPPRNWTNVSVTYVIEVTYYVEPAPRPGQDRSGKCVVEYRISVNMSGLRGGMAVSETHRVIAGAFWFENANLRTMPLANQ